MTPITSEKLIAMVRQAFKDVQRGSGTTLHQTRVIDDYGSAEKQEQARKLDTDQHWWEVADATIEQHGLTYLDGPGLRYYLPAFMTYALRHGGSKDGWVVGDSTVWQLANPRRKDDFDLLDARQAKVVARYLQFVAEASDECWGDAKSASRGIKRYWRQFL